MPPQNLSQLADRIVAVADEQAQLSVRTILPGPINQPPEPAPSPEQIPASIALWVRGACPVHPKLPRTRYQVCQVCVSQVVRNLIRFKSGGTLPKKGTLSRDAVLHLEPTDGWKWTRDLENLRRVMAGGRVLSCGGCGRPALPGVSCPICVRGGTDIEGDPAGLLCDCCGSAADPRTLTLTAADGAVCPSCVADIAETGRAA